MLRAAIGDSFCALNGLAVNTVTRNDRFLLGASRFLAISAVVVGLALGLFEASIIASVTCFDSCPGPSWYFAHQAPGAAQVMIPCIVLEIAAVATFWAFCASTAQTRRAVRQVAILLGGGLVGAAALGIFMRAGQASLPITASGDFAPEPLIAWTQLSSLALTVVVGVWSTLLAALQWAAE